jgi:hypothetical protein
MRAGRRLPFYVKHNVDEVVIVDPDERKVSWLALVWSRPLCVSLRLRLRVTVFLRPCTESAGREPAGQVVECESDRHR